MGGEILDSYRSSYEDLLANPPVSDAAIQIRMDEQHKAIIRDIKNGKYDSTPPDPQEQQVFNERSLDQAILEFLQHEGDVDTLELVLEIPLSPIIGKLFDVQMRARLTNSQNPVRGADVAIRLISSLKKAVPLLNGKTDEEGTFRGQVELPPSQPGHCAIVVSCASEFGNDELKALVGS